MRVNLPKISLITPSYNQAGYIRKTIDSVLMQNYPFLEYVVLDGGSTDETVEILKHYGKKIRWISKRDKGQSEAINKGLRITTGEIVGFINSDDYLESGCLLKVGRYFAKHNKIYWITGK